MPQTAIKREFPRFCRQYRAFLPVWPAIAAPWRLINPGAFGKMGIFRTAT
jgi:hypothetical protein